MTYGTLKILLALASCAHTEAWFAREWTTTNQDQKRHHKVVVEERPEVTNGYCVARGYFDQPEFTFVAAARRSPDADPTGICEKRQFPERYFYVDKRVHLNKALEAISSIESALSKLSENNLSEDAVWVTSRGQLRRLDYLSLNREPWSFVYCEVGDLISNSRCRILSVSVTAEGAIASMSLNELVDD